MSNSNNIVWAIRVKYLDYHGNWHQKQTKWHDNLNEAWEESEKLENKVEYLELSEGVLHKQKN
jgi:hypothetical protein